MGFVNFIFIFALVWWTVIFAVLPWGNHRAENVETGHASGAPANPNIRKKLWWTTGISFALTALVFVVIKYSGFSFHDSVQAWTIE